MKLLKQFIDLLLRPNNLAVLIIFLVIVTILVILGPSLFTW